MTEKANCGLQNNTFLLRRGYIMTGNHYICNSNRIEVFFVYLLNFPKLSGLPFCVQFANITLFIAFCVKKNCETVKNCCRKAGYWKEIDIFAEDNLHSAIRGQT